MFSNMSPYELMELKKESFTKNEKIIYEYMLNNATDVFRGGIVQLAIETGVSQPTITRFCKKLGYDNFGEFKMQLYREKKSSEVPIKGSDMHYPMLFSYKNLIYKLDQVINEDILKKLAREIISVHHVFIVGAHKSKLSADLLKYNLMKFGIYCSSFGTDDQFEVYNLCKKNDLVIIISASGDSYKEFIKEAKQQKLQVALLTMNSCFHMKELDYTIWLPNHKNQEEYEFTENTIIFSIFVDLLTSFIARIDK